MADIPIIFSAPMVDGLLNDRKTMTRRIASLRNCVFGSIGKGRLSKEYWAKHADWYGAHADAAFGYLRVPTHTRVCPDCSKYGWEGTAHRLRTICKPGDRLWVRENFYHWGRWIVDGKTDAGRDRWRFKVKKPPLGVPVAMFPGGVKLLEIGVHRTTTGYHLRPAIHMPRSVSRLTLPVFATKIERLNDISPDDAINEGMHAITKDHWRTVKYGLPDRDGEPGNDNLGWNWEDWRISPVDAFARLWNQVHGVGTWLNNPFVTATTFTVQKSNIDAAVKEAA